MMMRSLARTLFLSFVSAQTLLVASTAATRAGTVDVQMLNRGAHGTMVFEPDFVQIAPGDTVTFRVGHKSHNAASIATMVPEGFAGFTGKINEEISITFDQPGLYGIKCSPHYTMGMVMVIRVGDAARPEGFPDPSVPPASLKRFEEILARSGL